MIVRLMGEGQYRIDDAVREQLDALDDRAMAAIEANDETTLEQQLNAMWEIVRAEGKPLADDDLSPSNAIVPRDDIHVPGFSDLFLPTRLGRRSFRQL